MEASKCSGQLSSCGHYSGSEREGGREGGDGWMDGKMEEGQKTSSSTCVCWYYSIVTHRKCIAKHMINPRISAVWSTTKPIKPFSCTRRVQEVHTKADVVHLTPGLLGLWGQV